MGYEVEELASVLMRARKTKGLSQRDLSARAGVPQSHISKIETGGVDLRISSLASIAHALDLEIVLVPRKVIPAVKSIARSVDVVPQTMPGVADEMARIAKKLESVERLNIDMNEVRIARRHFNDMKQFQNLIKDTAALQRINDTMKLVTESGDLEALQNAVRQMTGVRNRLAHLPHTDIEPSELPHAAYQLSRDDDG